MPEIRRELYFYKDYFLDFYRRQSWKVQRKILWTLQLIESVDRIPGIYFKHLENTVGMYEIRVQAGSDIFRIFCFFDDNDSLIVGHGFQKKTQKTPAGELQKAARIKKEYYEEKEPDKPR